MKYLALIALVVSSLSAAASAEPKPSRKPSGNMAVSLGRASAFLNGMEGRYAGSGTLAADGDHRGLALGPRLSLLAGKRDPNPARALRSGSSALNQLPHFSIENRDHAYS